MAPESDPGPPGDAEKIEATTQADGDWPVAEQYQVVPEPDLEHQLEEERGAVTIASPPRRSGVPALVSVAAVLALLLLAGAAAAWLVTRPDSARSSSPPTQSRPTHSTTTPHNRRSAAGGPATTSSSTETTGSSTSTSTTSTTTTPAAPTIVVPDVVGLMASNAARKLRHAKLEPRILLVASARPNGTVLAQAPTATTKVDVESTVQLRVSKGPTIVRVSVPSLVGSTAATAKTRLSSLGLHWSVTMQASSQSRGTVLAQSPSPAARVTKGTTVRLTVSSGPAQVTVPDVTGLDAASARKELEDAGFDVVADDQPTSDPDQDGMVVDQIPAGGSTAAKGSTVTITVAHFS
jgi:beta-lactam-binding protein with PASTA domain